jgi:hypothetical protein
MKQITIDDCREPKIRFKFLYDTKDCDTALKRLAAAKINAGMAKDVVAGTSEITVTRNIKEPKKSALELIERLVADVNAALDEPKQAGEAPQG